MFSTPRLSTLQQLYSDNKTYLRHPGVSAADEDQAFHDIIRMERGMPYEVLQRLKEVVEQTRERQAMLSGHFISIYVCQIVLAVMPLMWVCYTSQYIALFYT